MTEQKYLVLLYSFTSFGPIRTKLLISYFGSAEKAWQAKKIDLKKLGLSDKVVRNFIDYRDKTDEKKYFERLNEKSVNFVTKKNKAYPANLKNLEDAPLVMYFKGKIKKPDELAIAIVGSRKMTSYGKEVAYKFSYELAGLGITVISGLARGIDTQAHKAALEAGGRTIAVVGSGLDNLYPSENTVLSEKIADGNGAVVSEYPLGHPALRGNFARRNRIISGLSKAVIVVEGEKKSGTLLTASHAANQGIEVFAVPGQIYSPLSAAPHFLIKRGAKMITSVGDVIEELNLQFKVDKKRFEKILPSDKEEEELIQILKKEPLHIDEIARISSLKASSVSARLTVMEIKGMIINLGKGVYKIKR